MKTTPILIKINVFFLVVLLALAATYVVGRVMWQSDQVSIISDECYNATITSVGATNQDELFQRGDNGYITETHWLWGEKVVMLGKFQINLDFDFIDGQGPFHGTPASSTIYTNDENLVSGLKVGDRVKVREVAKLFPQPDGSAQIRHIDTIER